MAFKRQTIFLTFACYRHVLLLERCRFWGGWDVEWSIDVDAILGVPAIHDGKLIFKVKQVRR